MKASILILTALCFYLYLLKGRNRKNKIIIWIIYSSLFAIAFYIALSEVITVIKHPRIWDFTAFYLYGKVAANGFNFYEPQSFQIVFNNLHLPFTNFEGIVGQVVNVGFPYPPPTILYFAPLGFLSFNTAVLLWTIFILLFLFGSIYIVYDQFLKEYKLNGLMLITTMFFLWPPVRETILYSQTNFIALFFLLLMYKYSDKKFSGIFLALAFFTKPYMIIFTLFFLLRKQWKTLIYFTVTTIIFTAITFFIFGKSPFISYIYNNPTKRLPNAQFSEDINQSLHAVLLRANTITMDKPQEYFYIMGCIFLLSAVYILFLLRRKLYDYIWAVLLLVALLVYPGTLSYYGVLLLFIIFQFFNTRNQLGFNMYITIPIVAIFYFLCSVSVFSCICFLLLIIIIKSIIDYRPTLK